MNVPATMRVWLSTACSVCDSIKIESVLISVLLTRQERHRNGNFMADEDDDQEQDDTPEPPQRLFTLPEAERARRELEPFLVEAIECRKKLSGLDNDLSAVATR